MDITELIDIVKSKACNQIHRYPELVKSIENATRFLDEAYQNSVLLRHRVHCLSNSILDASSLPLCSFCGENPSSLVKEKKFFSETCSPECLRKENGRKTAEAFSSKTQKEISAINEKRSKTYFEKTGYTSHHQDPVIKEAKKQTLLAKYGVENPMQCSEIKEKQASTVKSRYGVKNVSSRHLSLDTVAILEDRASLKFLYDERGGVGTAAILGMDSSSIYDRLRNHDIPITPTSTSHAEREIFEFIVSLGIKDATQSDRCTLGRKELDITIPSKKVAIEYNGLHWHSKKRKKDGYHLEKTCEAKSKGYRLVHIFEDEWTFRKDQVKQKLMSILGVDDRKMIYARKCEIIFVTDVKKIKSFYEKNHIQGAGKQSLTMGLVCDGEVVAMVSFSKRTDAEYELSRYATSCRVVGGFSKLFKHASSVLRDMGVETVVSFADKRYSEGNVYIVNGWFHVKDTPPDYQYVIGSRRVRKQNFRRKFLRAKLENFDPALSEMQNMMNHGLYPIYDCGLMKFEFSLD